MMPSQRRLMIVLTASLLGAALLAVGAPASAQIVPIRNVYISNGTEDWGGAPATFDQTGDLFIYVQFVTGEHGGFQWNGSCIVGLAATHAAIHRERVTMWVQAGNSVLRTAGFRVGWPQAAVELTCVPDGYPGGAFTSVIGAPTGGGGAPPPPPAEDPRAGEQMCRDALLAAGHSASYLSGCRGVDGRCAVALIRSGQSPSYLPGCQGVEPRCAEALLASGQSASYLSGCQGAEPRCAEALLRAGQSASYLPECRGADPDCAEALFRAGRSASYLGSCR